jgi:capsular exopolysaccharide synthesis family protein
MNIQNRRVLEENEIDITVIFRVLNRYKISIILFALLSTSISAIKVYFQPNIYATSTIVEIGIEGVNSRNDIISQATEGSSLSQDTEMGIIKSRFLAEYALKKVDFTHRYYTRKNMREYELYKSSPFEVNMTKGIGISFFLYPIDDQSYRLEIKDSDTPYDKIHRYNSVVKSDKFRFVLYKKEGRSLDESVYRFIVLDQNASLGYVVGNTSVSQMSKNSALLEITYRDVVPLRAQEYANALAKSYIEQSVYKKTREASKTLNFVDNQLLEINNNLKYSAKQLERFKVKTNTISIDAKSRIIVESINKYQSNLMQLEIQEELLDSLYRQVKIGEDLETLSMVGFGSENSEEGSLTGLVKDLQQSVLRVKLLRADYTEKYPEVKKLRQQINQLKKIIINTIKNMKKNISERKKLVEKSISQQQILLKKLPENEREYVRLERRFMINEKIYSYLLEQRSATAIAKASTVSKNRVLDGALYPRGAIEPDRQKIIIKGLLFGLILGIIYAFIREFMDNTIKDEDDITKETNAGILGTIPDMGKRYTDIDSLYVFDAPKSIITESYRNIRTNLKFLSPRDSSQIIVVTSTISNEGKTTISANLAAIISMTNTRVLLINLDMRKPILHEKFNIPNSNGISRVLVNDTLLEDAIEHTKYSKLDVITSGPIPPNPSELIQSRKMEDVLNRLREVYSVIIIDTPPVGIVTDARTLMGLADTTLYVVRANYAKKAFLKNINNIYNSKNIQNFGIVLNAVDIKESSYGYGYSYDSNYYTKE